MNNSFYKKSILVIITNITTGILGFMFSIILSKKIGPEGMGLYSLVSPISNLLFSILSGGLLLATSKVVAEYYAKKELGNLHKSIKTTVIFNLICSLIVISIAFLFSYSISFYLIKDIRTLTAFRFILISIIFMTMSNTYKGYFYGTTNVFVPAFIDVVEKVLRVLLLIIVFKYLPSISIESLITITFLLFFIGEVNSFILLVIYYHLDKRAHPKTTERIEDALQLLYNVFSISVPLMITELIGSSLYTVSSLMLPRRLIASGRTYNEALSLIGRFGSMSAQIVFFPMLIIFSVTTLLIPDLSSSIVKQDVYTARKRISQMIKIAIILGITVFLICFTLGDELGYLIFKRNDLGAYIRFLSFCAPVIYTSQATRSILNGMGKQKYILKSTFIISVIQTVFLYVLVGIPNINIYGYGITILVTTFIGFILNIREIDKVIHFKL